MHALPNAPIAENVAIIRNATSQFYFEMAEQLRLVGADTRDPSHNRIVAARLSKSLNG